LPYVVGRLRAEFIRSTRTISAIPMPRWRRCITTPSLQDSRTLRYLADIVGAGRIMMGSDMPFPIGDLAPLKIVRENFVHR